VVVDVEDITSTHSSIQIQCKGKSMIAALHSISVSKQPHSSKHEISVVLRSKIGSSVVDVDDIDGASIHSSISHKHDDGKSTISFSQSCSITMHGHSKLSPIQSVGVHCSRNSSQIHNRLLSRRTSSHKSKFQKHIHGVVLVIGVLQIDAVDVMQRELDESHEHIKSLRGRLSDVEHESNDSLQKQDDSAFDPSQIPQKSGELAKEYKHSLLSSLICNGAVVISPFVPLIHIFIVDCITNSTPTTLVDIE
jgi:hypothetical protein